MFVPWGATDFGEDVWLLENAIVFGLETLFEAAGADYADLYSQLATASTALAPVSAYSQDQIVDLARRAPANTSCIIDGALLISRDPESNALERAEIAPRLFLQGSNRWEAPDAIVLSGFGAHRLGRDVLLMPDLSEYVHCVTCLFQDVGRPIGVSLSAESAHRHVSITTSWPAFIAFLKAKRAGRTPEEKLGYYRQAIRYDPKFYWPLFNIGQIYKQQTDFATARRFFLKSAEAAPNDHRKLSETLFELGLCSVALGDTKTARRFWNEALASDPNNPTLLVNIAGTYEQEEDFGTAASLHRQAMDLSPDYHKAIVSLARLTAMLGKIDEAIPLYRRALSIEPDDALRQAVLGGCYAAVGDLALARVHFLRASELDPPVLGVRVKSEDDGDDQPAPGDYARQELAAMDRDRRGKR